MRRLKLLIIALCLLVTWVTIGGCEGDDKTENSLSVDGPIDISGVWKGEWFRSDGDEIGTLVTTLVQSGNTLSGDMIIISTTFKYTRDTDVIGSVEGNDVIFGIAIATDEDTVTIDYEGTITEDGNYMEGTYNMSTGYTGTWTATKGAPIIPTTTIITTTEATTASPDTTPYTSMTTTPTPTTASPQTPTPTGEDITVVSSSVFTRVSSILLDGESRRLTIVAELRNDSSVNMDLEHIYFYFYNASDEVVCTRWAYAFDDILPPGGMTVVEETIPSQIYWKNETNDFPEDWVRYEIIVNAQPAPETKEPIEVTIQNVEVTATNTGGLRVTGNVLNNSQDMVKNVKPYVILYSSDGTILNTEEALSISELGPGESQNFEITFLVDEPIDYDHYVVKAYAESS